MALSSLPKGVIPIRNDKSTDPEEDQDIDIGGEPDDITENPDGSASFSVTPSSGVAKDPKFYANLAEEIEETKLQEIATELMRKIERDKEARKKRDQQYEEGIKRTGLANDAPGGATFEGASKAVHPMLAEGCVDFAASAMRELFPPNGPVKTKIEGDVTEQKMTLAKRQEKCLNWQLTEQISEYCDELEQTLTQVPLGGSQYMKFWYDGSIRRIQCEFIPIDDMLIPYSCTDFYTAQRITHVQRLTQFIFEERVESGFYRDLEASETSEKPEQSKAAIASDKVEGKEDSLENVDGERVVFEVNTYADFGIDGDDEAPYLISIDDSTHRVVSVYRNWKQEDDSRTRLEWIVEYGFIAWRGAYKIGLPHLIGGLSAAATGALRALLDSAHINTMPGFLKLKGARLSGQSKQINATQGIEIDASVAVDDINKLVMKFPYNPPSPTLFQLLDWLTTAAKGVVTTSEEKISEANANMPVGTTLALIEQGAKVFSSIHARLHRSQKRALKIISRLNAEHLSSGEQMQALGEILATKEDFNQPLAVVPVSDPNIFSETQRYAQMQMLLDMAQKFPQLHNLYKILNRMYEIAKIPEISEFLPEQKAPTELNAAAENSAVMLGRPVIAFPEQDHLAHLETHLRFITDPFLGGADFSKKVSYPAMIEHVKQHLAFLYARTIFDMTSQTLGADIGQMLKQNENNPAIDKLLAAASKSVHEKMQGELAPLGPILTNMVQTIAQMQPPPVQDPSQAAVAIAQMENTRATAADQEKAKNDQQQLGLDQQKVQISAADLERKKQKDEQDAQLKDRDITLDNAVDIARLHAEQSKLDAQLKEDAQPGNQLAGE